MPYLIRMLLGLNSSQFDSHVAWEVASFVLSREMLRFGSAPKLQFRDDQRLSIDCPLGYNMFPPPINFKEMDPRSRKGVELSSNTIAAWVFGRCEKESARQIVVLQYRPFEVSSVPRLMRTSQSFH
jgi:hypothetical protein